MASVNVNCSLKFRDGKKWKQRWCTLKKLSPVADCLHLCLRKEAECLRSSLKGSDEAILPLDDFFGVDSGFELDREKYVMGIICRPKVVLLAFHNQETLDVWKRFICSHLGEDRSFKVHMVKTPLSLRSHVGPIHLFIHGGTICVATCGQNGFPPVYLASWNLSDLRRFGVQNGFFCFEAGDHSEFTGVFAFSTEQATEIESRLKVAATVVTSDRRRSGLFNDSCYGSRGSLLDQRSTGTLQNARVSADHAQSDVVYHNIPLADGLRHQHSVVRPPVTTSGTLSDTNMSYYNVPTLQVRSPSKQTAVKTTSLSRTADVRTVNSINSASNNAAVPSATPQKSSGKTTESSTPQNHGSAKLSVSGQSAEPCPSFRRSDSSGNAAELSSGSLSRNQQKSVEDRRNNRLNLRRHSLGDIYRKIHAVVEVLSLPRRYSRSTSKCTVAVSDDGNLDFAGQLVTSNSEVLIQDEAKTTGDQVDNVNTSVLEPPERSESVDSVLVRPNLEESVSTIDQLEEDLPPPPPPRCSNRIKKNSHSNRLPKDDAYIDCNHFITSSKSKESTPVKGREPSLSAESTPLLRAHGGRRIVSPPPHDCSADSNFLHGKPMQEYMLRSCSLSSQLSAAVSSVYESSCPDLLLETLPVAKRTPERVSSAAEAHYLPMFGNSSSDSCASVGNRHGKIPSHNIECAKSPSSDRFSAGTPRHSAVDRTRSAIGGARSPKQACRLAQHASLSAPHNRIDNHSEDESGYLLFRMDNGITHGAKESPGSSLERLGPPPAVPSTADIDYMNLANSTSVPPLPPKMSVSSGTRIKPAMPQTYVDPSAVGPATEWKRTAVDNRTYGSPAGAVGDGVVTRDKASRKPNLTLTDLPLSSSADTRFISGSNGPRFLSDLRSTRISLPATPASALSAYHHGSARHSPDSIMLATQQPQRTTSQAITTQRPRNGCEYLRINRRRLGSSSVGDGSPLPSCTPHSPGSNSMNIFNFEMMRQMQGGMGGESPHRSHSSRLRPVPPNPEQASQPQTIALDEVLVPALPSPKVTYTDLDLVDVPSTPVVPKPQRIQESATEYAIIDYEATSAASRAGQEHVRYREDILERRPIAVSRAGSIATTAGQP